MTSKTKDESGVERERVERNTRRLVWCGSCGAIEAYYEPESPPCPCTHTWAHDTYGPVALLEEAVTERDQLKFGKYGQLYYADKLNQMQADLVQARDSLEEAVSALERAEEALWSVEASDFGTPTPDTLTAIQGVAKDAADEARTTLDRIREGRDG